MSSIIDHSKVCKLPLGSHPDGMDVPHFPNLLFAFVWRNWELVEPARLALVVGTTPENIVSIATSMGLSASPEVSPEWRTRGYITLIRRNWHLLPYEQLLILLDVNETELAFYLREDDGLFLKLGNLKPNCPPLRYATPSKQEFARAAEIKSIFTRHFGNSLDRSVEARFQFVKQLSEYDSRPRGQQSEFDHSQPLRLIYSYFGGYGDALSDPSADPYPDGLLARFADLGINGVWLHAILRLLAPGNEDFPEFGEGWQQRLENLRALTERASRYGIGVYLYLNEPRAMPESFFANRSDMAGVREGELIAMCSSHPKVRAWITDSLAHLFREVPLLAGAFTITASEGLTNCACRFRHHECPRCKERSSSEIVGEVNAAIASGIHRGNPNARVIAWDWGWNQDADGALSNNSMQINWGGQGTNDQNLDQQQRLDWAFSGHGEATQTIEMLPDNIELMSASEWALPIMRGGVTAKINEYSLSAAGPGPRATMHWKAAREKGMRTVAKVQANNSWELSTVPYLPVLDLVADHFANLAAANVDGVMLSWTLGGYPSLNLLVAQEFARNPHADKESVLDSIANQRYGEEAASLARCAWSKFSKAFQQFPFDINVLYNGPQHMGPANLLHAKPTGFQATMVGIPYDDIENWRGPYPPEVLGEQFTKVAREWRVGLGELQEAVSLSNLNNQSELQHDLGVATAAYCHFASAANQVYFILARDALIKSSDETKKAELRAKLATILESEIELAAELYDLSRHDSRLGFEPSNQYCYVPGDLIEKAINCRYLAYKLADNTSCGTIATTML
jgi:hypothetical protein